MKLLRSILFAKVYFTNGWCFRFWSHGGYIIFLGVDWQLKPDYQPPGSKYGWSFMLTVLNFNLVIDRVIETK